jgi:SAM-dependent methyltransferase
MTAPAVHRDTPAGWTAPAGDYDRWFDEPWGRYAFAVEAATVLRAAGALDGRRLLDAGCGTGRFGTVFTRRGSLVVGVDPDAGMVAIARSRLAGRCVRGASEDLPFPAETFDLTVAVTVLEFVTDPAAAVAELARVTRPGGRILIGALNPRSPWGLANHRRLRSGVWCHARFLSRGELRSLAAPHGASTLHAGLFAPGAFPALRLLGPALEALGTVAPALGAFQVVAIDKPPVDG